MVLMEVTQYGKEEIDVDEVAVVVIVALLEQERKVNRGKLAVVVAVGWKNKNM